MAGITITPKSLSHAAIGVGATLISKMLSTRTWTLYNNDSREQMVGQFPAEGIGREAGSNWSEISSLNRQNPILQFISGKAETLSIQARFFKKSGIGPSVDDLLLGEQPLDVQINKLISWTKRDQRLGRPPIFTFWIGDGTVVAMQVILEGVTGIQYSAPTFFGGIREVKFTLNLRQHTPFNTTDKEVTDTRYHRTKEGQYYELIAQEEYGNPMLGDAVRKLDYHIGKPIIRPGDVVKLPSIEGIRTKKIAQTSNILKTAYGKKETPQRNLRLAYFEALTVPRNTFFLDRPVAITLPLTGGIFDFTFDESFE